MIEKLKLSNFRNFEKKEFDFSGSTNVIVAPNASGKTNILEAINLLATGKSFKAKTTLEMIRYDENVARVQGLGLEVVLTTLPSQPQKRLLVNDIPRRLVDFVGNFRTVFFGPWDLDLVNREPSLRRGFLDNVLSQTDYEYRRALLSYEKGIRQRNRLLVRIRDENLSYGQLVFWDKLVIKNGDYISSKREEFVKFTDENKEFAGTVFSLEYDKSVISEERLLHYKNQEVASGMTLVGPHRDDFKFKIVDRDLASFGSRGEQRMAVLWLKMLELSYIEKITNGTPTLLLDDIFSELDHEHRELVMEMTKNKQVIITTSEPHYIPDQTVSLNLLKL